MRLLKRIKEAFRIMSNIFSPQQKSESVLGKRKLDLNYSHYSAYSASAKRPPLASPNLGKNSGVKTYEKGKR